MVGVKAISVMKEVNKDIIALHHGIQEEVTATQTNYTMEADSMEVGTVVE